MGLARLLGLARLGTTVGSGLEDLRRWRLSETIARLIRQSLLRNSLSILATTAVTAGIGYVYWIIAAHLYATASIGLAAALLQAMTLASLVSNIGGGSTLMRALPRAKRQGDWLAAVNAVLYSGAGFGMLAGCVLVAALPLLSHQFAVVRTDARVATAVVLGVPLLTLSTLLDVTFVAERVAHSMLVRNVVFAISKIPLLILPALAGHASVLALLLSWDVATAVSVLVGALLLLPRHGRRYGLTVKGVRQQLTGQSFALVGHHLINVGAAAPAYILPVLVAARLSPTANAYYYTSAMVGSVFFMVSPAVAMALFAEGSHSSESLRRGARSSMIIIASFLGPAILGVVLGGRLILSVFGPEYARHGLPLLIILVVSAVPDAVNSVYISILRVRLRLRVAATLNVGMAVIAVALSWYLLPRLGIAGAGWAWLLANLGGTGAIAGFSIWGRLPHGRRRPRPDPQREPPQREPPHREPPQRDPNAGTEPWQSARAASISQSVSETE